MAEKQLMTLNEDENVYYGVTLDGQKIRVEAAAYSEALRNIPQEEVNDPDYWALLVSSNPHVTVVDEFNLTLGRNLGRYRLLDKHINFLL